jgi:carbon monoxide dehydrogenase subunit G
MRFKFQVAVEVLRIEAPRAIEVRLEGRPLGIVGRLTASSLTTLEEAGAETRLRYATEMALAGKLGSIGQSVFAAKAKEMETQFAANLSAVFAQQKTAP